MIAHRLKIREKTRLTKSVFTLEFMLPGLRPSPGQFFQVRVGEGLEPFLNRPISIASYRGSRLVLAVKIVGRGTEMLSRKEPGEELQLLGPFGARFKPARRRSLLIAGGIGIAPLRFLAEFLAARRTSFDLLYGVRTSGEFVFRRELARMAERAVFVAERGYKKKETVVSRLRQMALGGFEVAYACGPRPMFVALQRLDLPMPVYAFCEDFMGCGCGLCMGCAIMYQGAYRRICVDGPVFELGGIDFEV